MNEKCLIILSFACSQNGLQEYVRPGMRMLFRDGRVRGVGLVTAIPTVEPAH